MRLISTGLSLCCLWKYLVSAVLFRLGSSHETYECQSVKKNKCLSPTRGIICIKMWKFGELRGVPERNQMEGWFSPLFYSVGEERRAGGQGVSFFHFHPTVEEKNGEVGGRTSEFGRCCSRSGSTSGPDWMGTLGPGSVRMKQSDVDPVLPPLRLDIRTGLRCHHGSISRGALIHASDSDSWKSQWRF